MVGDLRIERERPDHPEVAALLAALDDYLASLYPPEANHILGLDALLANDVDFVAARRDGRIVGCGAVRRLPAALGGGDAAYGEIKRMMVDPACRGLGIGARILAALEAALPPHGVTRARLETGRDQTAALRLYRRCGYRERAAFGGYPDNGLSMFMEKSLA